MLTWIESLNCSHGPLILAHSREYHADRAYVMAHYELGERAQYAQNAEYKAAFLGWLDGKFFGES